jgi:hypothetical protein
MKVDGGQRAFPDARRRLSSRRAPGGFFLRALRFGGFQARLDSAGSLC